MPFEMSAMSPTVFNPIQLCRQLWSALRALPVRDRWSLLVLVGLLGALEYFGRQHELEILDLLALTILLLVAGVHVAWHQRGDLQWTHLFAILRAKAFRQFRKLTFSFGADLRNDPPLPRGVPKMIVLLPMFILGLVGISLTWAWFFEMPFRPLMTQISYIGYLGCLAGLWGMLTVVCIVASLVPPMLVHDWLRLFTTLSARTVKSLSTYLNMVYFVATLLAVFWLPIWIPPILILAAFLMNQFLQALPPRRKLDCAWQANRDEPVRAMSAERLNFSLAVCGLGMLCILWGQGGTAIGLSASEVNSPITMFFGTMTAWFLGTGLVLYTLLYHGFGYLCRWDAPDQLIPPRLFVADNISDVRKQALNQICTVHGWKCVFAPGNTYNKLDVEIAFADAEDRAIPSSVLAVTDSDLIDERFIERVRWKDRVQRRRAIVKSLQTMFRRASRPRPSGGQGFWVAPHLWFIPALGRDEITFDHTRIMDVIPPLYRHAMPIEARSHFYEMCKALDVDILFVEDGVGFRGLRRVLRVMFERYDIDAGQQPLREIHFAGLPKIHVIIHEYGLDNPLDDEKYPEPDYREMGRARILHIFRDRGGEKEEIIDPVESDDIFSPVGSLF